MKGLRNPGLAQNSIVIEARKKKTPSKTKKRSKKINKYCAIFEVISQIEAFCNSIARRAL